jgi:hypothetical protein
MSVIPAGGPDGKRPLVHGLKRFSERPVSPNALRTLCSKYPEANIALLAGPASALTVVDLDDPTRLSSALERFGDTPCKAKTPRVFTSITVMRASPSLQHPNGEPSDIRAGGGVQIVIAPPSFRRDTGASYEWLEGGLRQLMRLPRIKAKSLADFDPVRCSLPREGYRNTWLFRMCLKEARHVDSLDDLIDVALTRNSDLPEPLPDQEAAGCARSAWNYEVKGKNMIGSGGCAQFDQDELRSIGTDGDLMLFLAHLRANHACRQEPFVVANALAKRIGWSIPYIRKLRGAAEARGFIECIHPGGKGPHDPPLYRWPSKVQRRYTNRTIHPPSLVRSLRSLLDGRG